MIFSISMNHQRVQLNNTLFLDFREVNFGGRSVGYWKLDLHFISIDFPGVTMVETFLRIDFLPVNFPELSVYTFFSRL
jgi:hypothetical protein